MKKPLLYLVLTLILALATGLFITYNKNDSAGSPAAGANETRWGEMAWDEGKWG